MKVTGAIVCNAFSPTHLQEFGKFAIVLGPIFSKASTEIKFDLSSCARDYDGAIAFELSNQYSLDELQMIMCEKKALSVDLFTPSSLAMASMKFVSSTMKCTNYSDGDPCEWTVSVPGLPDLVISGKGGRVRAVDSGGPEWCAAMSSTYGVNYMYLPLSPNAQKFSSMLASRFRLVRDPTTPGEYMLKPIEVTGS